MDRHRSNGIFGQGVWVGLEAEKWAEFEKPSAGRPAAVPDDQHPPRRDQGVRRLPRAGPGWPHKRACPPLRPHQPVQPLPRVRIPARV